MKKLKKLLALTLCILSCAIVSASCGEDEKKPSTGSDGTQTEQTDGGITATNATTINAILNAQSGEVTINVKTLTKLNTSASNVLTLGSNKLTKVVVDGGKDYAMLEFTGAGASAVQVNENATLVFKNLTLKDSTNVANQGYSQGYLKFGGNVRFENCRIYDGVALKNNANAVFEDCEFRSSTSNRYAAWVSSGNASFKNCTFTGYRAIKIHEELNSDVTEVSVDRCTFKALTTKPALAIGDIYINPTNTKISVTNCTLKNCAGWDKTGSIEGIDGLYEADTLTQWFNFVQTGNVIDGLSLDGVVPELKD